MKRLIPPCAITFSFLFPLQAETPDAWSNPILPQRADPHVFLHDDGHYYMIATVPEYDRIELRRGRTIAGLPGAEAKVIWRKHDKGSMCWSAPMPIR